MQKTLELGSEEIKVLALACECLWLNHDPRFDLGSDRNCMILQSLRDRLKE